MTIADIARDRVVTASPDASVKSVAESMAEQDVGCIVIEQTGEPIGLITDRKLALQLRDHPNLASHEVKEFMTTDLITVDEDDGIAEVLEQLSEAGIRRVPVVDSKRELTGIVSIDDIAVLLADEMENLAEIPMKQSPRF